MEVFKFGGASLNSSLEVENMASIVQDNLDKPLVVVVSAMGKSTNQLEEILSVSRKNKPVTHLLEPFKDYHTSICNSLFHADHAIFPEISELIKNLDSSLINTKDNDYDFAYDQCVSFGEQLSSNICQQYLVSRGVDCTLFFAPDFIKTDQTYREALVDWRDTTSNVKSTLGGLRASQVGLTQGFISGDSKGSITTLGREGSDYSASILACCLDADSLTVWKDVPGIMNGDPKRIENTIKYDELSYKEASEMTYYGAKVIHQDTIKPLSDQNITMYVRSFSSPTIPGTKIHRCEIHHQIPCIIYKENQCLISFRFNDYTYINEQNLVTIYDVLDKLRIRVNMMQNSAISFSVCIDYNEKKVLDIIAKLKHHFEIHYNNDLTMMTIKNYNNKAIHDYSPTSDVLLEQKTRADIQLVYRQE